MKISDLKIKEIDKKILCFCAQPRTISQIAGKTDLCYSAVSQKLSIFHAKEWLIKRKGEAGKLLYSLNNGVLEL